MTAHGLYVLAAYAVTGIVLAGLIGWLIVDYRSRRRDVAELEAAGLRRRSDSRAAE